MSGLFITFEGGEGSGKSTQMRIVADRLSASGLTVHTVREPGDTAVGEAVRHIVLDAADIGIDPMAELLLFEAARAQLVADVVRPALEAGETVLCDRHADSSVAYQGHARGLDVGLVKSLNTAATRGLVPDRTLVYDLDPVRSVERATARGADRIEAEEIAFHERVRAGYLAIAASDPERVRIIDASGSIDQVAERTARALADLPGLGIAVEHAE